MECREIEKIRIEMDVVKQIIYILKRCRSVEEAVEKLQILLAELESMYDVELLDNPALVQVLSKSVFE